MNLLLIFFGCFAFAQTSTNKGSSMEYKPTDKALRLFTQPLILGASVSAGFGTSDGGPGTVVSRMINPKSKVTNRAMSGHTSVESTRNLDVSSFSPSVILAFDLFFWDANRELAGREFETQTRKFFKTIQDAKIPMVVGRVPVGVAFPDGIREAGKKPSTARVNSLLEELCTLEKNCILYDPKICFDLMGGPVSPEGVRYFSDSLHTTNEGNKFCGRIFVSSGLVEKLTPRSETPERALSL
jgi:hypothetical protein